MGLKDLHNFSIEVILKKLKNGTSLETICSFYNTTREEIINELKSYYNVSTEAEVQQILYARKREFSRPKDSIAIKAAIDHKKRGGNYESFIKMLEESKRPFSKEALIQVQKVFEDKDEIEI